MCGKGEALAAREQASRELYQACCASSARGRLRDVYAVPEQTPPDLAELARAIDQGGRR